MRSSTIIALVLFSAAIGLIGCSSEKSCPVPTYEPEVLYQIYPTWITEDLILFENHEQTPESDILSPKASNPVRICAYSFTSNTILEVYPAGTRPIGQPANGTAAWLSPDYSGVVVTGNSTNSAELTEPGQWDWRGGPCISPSGTYLAWHSMGEDHEKGVWIYNQQTTNYQFIGSGASPVWHPVLDILYYNGTEAGQGASLMICMAEQWESEIVTPFPTDVSGAYFSFSPDGKTLAFSNPGYPNIDGVWTLDLTRNEFTHRVSCSVRGMTWGPSGIIIGTGCPDEEEPGCGRLWSVDPESWEMDLLLIH